MQIFSCTSVPFSDVIWWNTAAGLRSPPSQGGLRCWALTLFGLELHARKPQLEQHFSASWGIFMIDAFMMLSVFLLIKSFLVLASYLKHFGAGWKKLEAKHSIIKSLEKYFISTYVTSSETSFPICTKKNYFCENRNYYIVWCWPRSMLK